MSETLIESVVNGELDVDLVIKWLREEPFEDGITVPQALSDVSRTHFAAVLLHYIHSRTDHCSVAVEAPDGLNDLVVDQPQPNAEPTAGDSVAATGPLGQPRTGRGRGRRSPGPRASCLGDYFITRTTHTHKKRGGNKNTSTESVESPHVETNRQRQTNGTPIHVTEDTDLTPICGTRQPQNSNEDVNIISPNEKKRVTPISVKSPLNVTPVRVMSRTEVTPARVTTKEKSSEIDRTPTTEKKRVTPANVTPMSVKSPAAVTPSHFETPEPVTPNCSSTTRVTPLHMSSPVTPWSDRWSPSSGGSVMTPMTSLTTTPIRVTPSVNDTGDASSLDRHRVRCPPRALLTAFDAPPEPLEPPPRLPSDPGPSRRLARLYSAVLDSNLTTALPQEIAYLGSLLSCADEATAWFACQSLHEQRGVLRLVLDSTGLRALAEHLMVSRLCPSLSAWAAAELASRGRAAAAGAGPVSADSAAAGAGSPAGGDGGRFHADTDGAGSFGSPHCFNAARKQRDGLHDVIRWWRNGGSLQGPAALAARGRALLAAGRTADTTARLASLAVSLLLSDIAIHPPDHTQSKLHKLRRRLTAPAPAARQLQGEAFYRELVSCLDHASWRAHMSDAIAAELANMLASTTQPNTSEELSGLFRSVCALARLLGLVAALPYCSGEPGTGQTSRPRPYWQPAVQLWRLVAASAAAGRLCLGAALLLHWAAQLPPPARRLPYCRRLLARLRRLHSGLPAMDMPRATRIYLTWVLSSTLSLPGAEAVESAEVPSSPESEVAAPLTVSSEGIDGSGALDWAAILECCPHHKGILGPLVPGNGPSSMGRHVRPVTLPADPDQKERELQSRLEWQVVAAAGAGARRALELCEERAAATAARGLMATVTETRQTARQRLRDVIAQHTQTPPLAFLEQELRSSLSHAISVALASCSMGAREHAAAAAAALLGPVPARDALASVAARRAKRTLQRWAEAHCTPDTICPDMAAEVRSVVELVAAGAPSMAPKTPPIAAIPPAAATDAKNLPSMAETLIVLKECISQSMEGECSPAVPGLIPALSALACSLTSGSASAHSPHAALLLNATLDLCVAMAAFTPRSLTPGLLCSLSPAWCALCVPPSPESPPSPVPRGPSPSPDRAPTPPSSDDDGTTPTRIVIDATASDTAQATETLDQSDAGSLASRLFCPRNIHMLHLGRGEETYSAWQRLLRHLLELGLLSPAAATSAGLRLYARGRVQWRGQGLVAARAALAAAAAALPHHAGAPLLLLSDYASDVTLPE